MKFLLIFKIFMHLIQIPSDFSVFKFGETLSLASLSFKTLKLVGIRAALSWTFSIVMISEYWFKTGNAYSKCGLTNDVFNFFHIWISLLIKVFLNISITEIIPRYINNFFFILVKNIFLNSKYKYQYE